MKRGATLSALVAAALFGLTAPVIKALGVHAAPLIVSGFLYIGAGVALLPFRRRGAPLRRADAPLLAGVVLAGGVVAPALLLFGLSRSSAATTSLLLNLETVFTTLIAAMMFGEQIGRHAVLALLLVLGGAAALTFEPGGVTRSWLGPLAICGACAAWGLDNNLTQRLSLRDPIALVRLKGLAAGALSLALGFSTGSAAPAPRMLLVLVLVGALGYGLSLVLYVRSLAQLGAARTGVLFATAPFAGALAALPLTGERPSWTLAAAALAMAGGVALLAFEQHEHEHTHDAADHDHRHVHDEHHQHPHRGDEGPEPHSHEHHHDSLTHSHEHAPDPHHRHKH
jgi:drug/metabolite transporter (DMT)-like permease